tara:strand:- start:457 stop:696 length:240 start_codon:yes stop_codon:yes gene_type:complete
MLRREHLISGSFLLILFLVSCGSKSSATSASQSAPPEKQQPLQQIALLDANATSPSFGETILPEDYLGTISAWYFGHSS